MSEHGAREMPGPRIIVALDFPAAEPALDLARRLSPEECRVKVGKALFTRAGPAVARALRDLGFEVFLDLKYHDIPSTVAAACRAAAELGVWMVNVHVGGGAAMLRAAREALGDKAGEGDASPWLIGVTVLTSMDDAALKSVGVSAAVESQVSRLADLAVAAGLDGVVAAATECRMLRRAMPPGFKLVTPGIRPAAARSGIRRDDQARVMTPAAAVAAGSDYLVIGRPITAAADPAAALGEINREMDRAIKRESGPVSFHAGDSFSGFPLSRE